MNKLSSQIKTEHFLIHYNEEDKDCIDDVTGTLESGYNKVSGIDKTKIS